ncbi:unnamed protein product [Linum trigynum]|uniref:Uncharacterized protein n=1 Tax=Linum trigynum TaxID=586398 RepID=A0AAV2DBL1_9ROSI
MRPSSRPCKWRRSLSGSYTSSAIQSLFLSSAQSSAIPGAIGGIVVVVDVFGNQAEWRAAFPARRRSSRQEIDRDMVGEKLTRRMSGERE